MLERVKSFFKYFFFFKNAFNRIETFENQNNMLPTKTKPDKVENGSKINGIS